MTHPLEHAHLSYPERDALLGAHCGDPFSLLGPHALGAGRSVVRVLLPLARAVELVLADDTRVPLQRIEDTPLFATTIAEGTAYRLHIHWDSGAEQLTDDPYAFGPLVGELDLHLFAEGNHRDLGHCLGARPMVIDPPQAVDAPRSGNVTADPPQAVDAPRSGNVTADPPQAVDAPRSGNVTADPPQAVDAPRSGNVTADAPRKVRGVRFAVWAPSARRVSVVGDFNGWDGRRHPMRRRVTGVWELFVPDVAIGARYKYEILGPHGPLPLKMDPVSLQVEAPPATASVVADDTPFTWTDAEWMATRSERTKSDRPLSIYEVHLASWRRSEGGAPADWDRLGDELVPYVKELGFTHLELLPIMAHPFGGSWGYQPLGLYAPHAEYGEPAGFARFVDRCHAAGIGVLLDWVPAHFPTDAHGLARFDGTALYEHEDPREGFHQDWNTLIYNLGRNEVHGFLIGSALHWLEHFHVDGLRVDAVASMLYRDYSRKAGEWIPNRHGGRENLEAVDFLRHVNDVVSERCPGALMIAEESTSWPGVTHPTRHGGLGFHYKWNMGWMHDTLEYIERASSQRTYVHERITFGLVYASAERFVLPLSHDEVVHGKRSMLGKVPGDRWQQFATLRAYYGFMWAHPGKKLLFMGGELGESREWNHDAQLDWESLADPLHAGLQRAVRDLNVLYTKTPALHEKDGDGAGFEWIVVDDRDNSVFVFLRRGIAEDDPILVVSNFTPTPHHEYRIGVPFAGAWAEQLNTDATLYGGSDVGNRAPLESEPIASHGHAQSLRVTVPPLATVFLRRVR